MTTVLVRTPLGLSLSVRLWGPADAPPILLLHGYMDTAEAFAATVEPLARHWRIIAPDQRGHGESGHVGPGGYYHFPDYVMDVAAIMAQLVPEDGSKPVLVGHSMGASVALYYAGAFPGRARGLVLVDGIGPPSQDGDAAPALMRRWISAIDKAAADRAAPATYSADSVRKRLKASAPGLSDAQREAVLRSRTRSVGDDGETIHYRFDRLHRTPGPWHLDQRRFEAFCEAVDAPTLAIWGERTPFRHREAEQRLALIADVQEATIPNAGHNIHLEQPAALADAIAGFLRSLERSS